MSAITFKPNAPGSANHRSAESSVSGISGIRKIIGAIACAFFLSNGVAGQLVNDPSLMISRNYTLEQPQLDCPAQFKQLAIYLAPDETILLETLIRLLERGAAAEALHYLKNNRFTMLSEEIKIGLILQYPQFAEQFIEALQPQLNAYNIESVLWSIGKVPLSKSLIQCLARNYYPGNSLAEELQTIDKITHFGGALSAQFLLPHFVHYHNLGLIQKLAQLSKSNSASFWGQFYEAGLDSRFFNIPDQNGNTLIHKFIRGGEVAFAKLLIQGIPPEQLVLGHFSQEDLMTCLTDEAQDVPVGSSHNQMIAQKGCHAVLLQEDGTVVSLPGQNANQLYRKTMNVQDGMTAFRIYLNPGHASIRLPTGHYGFYAEGDRPLPTQVFQQFKCIILNDDHHAGFSDQTNELALIVYASQRQLEAMQRYIEETAVACQLGTMSYQPIQMNCIDFVQKTIEAAGITANFRNAFRNTDYLQKSGIAPYYAMLRSTGPTYTFPSSVESTKTKVYNKIPRRGVFAALSCTAVGIVGRVLVSSARCGGRGIAKIAYGVSRVWSAFRR